MSEYFNDMVLFVEVVRANSFRKAGQVLGMPNSTLSRRIGELEKSIGLRLMNRKTRKLELTEAGRVYFERCNTLVDEAHLIHAQLGDMLAQPVGVLRVSLPVDFSTIYLAPLIMEFAELYPGITFDLDLSSRRVDLISERYDLAIRMGESKDSGLIARPLASLVPYLYASPNYLRRHGEPRTPDELGQHACLSMLKVGEWALKATTQKTPETQPEPERMTARRASSEESGVMVSFTPRFALNSIGLARSLAVSGGGIVLMPEEAVADEVARGNLRQIMPDWQGKPLPVYILTETRLLPAKTQRFIEFLSDRLKRLRP